MHKFYRLTKQEIGDAITRYIGLQEDKSFFPFHISGTDEHLVLPEEVSFHLEMVERGSKIGDHPHRI